LPTPRHVVTMTDASDTDATDEIGDDAGACRDDAGACRAPYDSFRYSSMDDDDDDDSVDYLPRTLIVSQVPNAVFEDEQAQVVNACSVFYSYYYYSYDSVGLILQNCLHEEIL